MKSRPATIFGGALIVLAGAAAYHGSLRLPFVFDDAGSVTRNLTLRHLWPVWPVLRPLPGGAPVSGRPILNLSFALNYALSGLDVWSYHLGNLLIHLGAGLALFGIVRRTWRRTLFAFSVALLWTVHPLQTESVVYLSQRAESLMGLFYLLTLYGFIRSADGEDPRRRIWAGLSIAACLLGMATKEVMVSAPLIVFLYDRTFVAGTFGDAWRRRRRYYLALASTWLVLIGLVGLTGGRGGTAGFGLKVTPWAYACVQFQAIIHYLRLAVWPHPLVFYYGGTLGAGAWPVGLDAAIVILLAAGTIFLLRRRGLSREAPSAALAFAGAWFFAILAPSSSFVPVGTELIAEHRMYLSLAAVVAAVVGGLYFLCVRLAPRAGAAIACGLCILASAGLGEVTAARVRDYRSGVSLWGDTVRKIPDNPTAANNLGLGLAAAGRLPEAIETYEGALRRDPNHPEILNNLGTALMSAGRVPEAVAAYEQALRLKPDYAAAHQNLGVALTGGGHLAEAVSHFEESARLFPDDPAVYYNLGVALLAENKLPETVAACRQALRLQPEYPEAENLLGNALRGLGRSAEAANHYAEAVRLNPDFPDARNNWGGALLEGGRRAEAIVQFQEALRLDPDYFEARCNLGFALLAAGQIPEAKVQFEAALRLRPGDATARGALDRLNNLRQGP